VPLLLTVQTAPVESTICVAEGIVVRFGEAAKTALLMQSRNMQRRPFNIDFILAIPRFLAESFVDERPRRTITAAGGVGAASATQ
jgi:hypothetical protein